MNFDAFDSLTFDCYGTLIDWESGIISALQPILVSHGLTVEDEEVLTIFGRIESAVEAEEYRPYREILAAVVDDCGEALGFRPSAEDSRRRALPEGRACQRTCSSGLEWLAQRQTSAVLIGPRLLSPPGAAMRHCRE